MITFKNVWKKYSKELFRSAPPALQDVSFSLKQGKTLGLIGANGAGKSTSIRLLMDFIRPTQGSISLFDRTPSDLSLRNQIGYLPETASFPANLTINDLIRFTGATCGIPDNIRKKRGEELLHQLGLWNVRRSPLRTYSKGMQQRANFILALLNDPQLLILDEPMSGLDPIGRGQIIDLIEGLKKQGKTVLFCSHILGDVDRLVDQLLVLHRGRILYDGIPAEFLKNEQQAGIESAYLSLINRTENAYKNLESGSSGNN
ncbi:MAG: ABC transporter ATP-binding protein [Desulforhopalus sp.]|nr:ABC transporter ATP-binding protein [Desulforhopalus sp.]